ncbi:RNA-binding domain-containing protein [Epithele typhae]|uniref:RNA-binding domain-containing protein n=1 Tax=Epithele typhae TaxID=378194 RepID=UPI0020074427|nr:RNA-binding domain-containing protein [Epithele typhae]KAH9941582.1 RNA-binding domain-containing protein [Epithele typhae]
MQAQPHHPRLNTYRSPKQRVLGNPAAQVAPAWRPNARIASGSALESRILLSRLPPDVNEQEVEMLFSKTVGPVKEVVIVYNSQARSRGMAIVTFTRPDDAVLARSKYNGKIVDGRRPIKIEIVRDDNGPSGTVSAPAAPPPVPTLLSRISPAQPNGVAAVPQANGRQNGRQNKGAPTNQQQPAQRQPAQQQEETRVRLRTKKGPRRLNKQNVQLQGKRARPKRKTAEELDAEMDNYRAQDNAVAG